MIIHQHNNEGFSGNLANLLKTNDAKEGRSLRKVIATGSLLNILLCAIKVIGGWLGNSDALIADGFHSLGDFATDIVMFLFVGISIRKATAKYSYGYGKFETFASLVASALIAAIGVTLIVEGSERIAAFANGATLERPALWTLGIILAAMLMKECLYRYYTRSGKKLGSSALCTIALHHRADAFASLATLIGVGCSIFFGEKLRILDPIVTLVLAAFIVVSAIRLFIPAWRELVEHSLPASVISQVRSAIETVAGVKEIKTIRSRSHGRYYIFDIGISVASNLTVEQGAVIAGKVEESVAGAFDRPVMVSVTIGV